MNSEMKLLVPSKFGETILVAVLDENDGAVWAARIVRGTMAVQPVSEAETIMGMTGGIVRAIDTESGVEITIIGAVSNET